MESNRKRISGTLSFINRINQIDATIRFWGKVFLFALLCYDVWGAYKLLIGQHGIKYGILFVKDILNWLIQCLAIPTVKMFPDCADAVLRILQAVDTSQLPAETLVLFGKTWVSIIKHFAGSIIVVMIMVAAAILIDWYERKRQTKSVFVRGAELFSIGKLNRLLKKEYGKGTIWIGTLCISRALEILGVACIGKPQQGKTVWINTLLDEIYKRNQRAVVLAAKAEDFITTHMNEEVDSLFCPLDIRHMQNHGGGWSIKNDVKSVEDFSVISRVLCPKNPNAKDPLWEKGELMALEGLLKYWWTETDRSNKALAVIAKMTQLQMSNILKVMPECSDSYGLISNPKSQTSYSFYVSILADLKPLSLLGKADGTFSIIKWLEDENAGRIYIPMNDRAEAMLSPLYAMFLEIIMLNHMELPQDRNRRIFYILDEVANLPKLSIGRLMSKAPSFGASVCTGIQSLSALDEVYSENGRRSILNSSAVSLIFCCEDDVTADAMAKRIGMQDVENASENLSTSSNENKDGITSMLKIDNQNVVKADEIRNLKPLNLYVRVAGFGSVRAKLKYVPYKQINPAFVPNPAYSLEAFEEEHRQLVEDAKNRVNELEPENTVQTEHDQEGEAKDSDDLMRQAAQLIQDNDDGNYR